MEEKPSEIKWNPEGLGLICLHCGLPNPDNGDKCGNCGENPFIPPKLLTIEQMEIKKGLARRKRQPATH